MPGKAGIRTGGIIFDELLAVEILSLHFHLLNQLFHPAQSAHELVVGSFGAGRLLLRVPGTLGKDAIEVGARTWRAGVLFVAFDLSLPAMGTAERVLGWISLTRGGGAQRGSGRWALQGGVGHEGGRRVCVVKWKAW